MHLKDQVSELLKAVKDFSATEIIKFAHERFADRVNFASSLGEEDQALTDMIRFTSASFVGRTRNPIRMGRNRIVA